MTTQYDSYDVPAINYAEGIGDAVADRTVNRKIERMTRPRNKTIKLVRDDSSSLDDSVKKWAKANSYLIEADYEVLHGDDTNVEIVVRIIGELVTEKWADVARRVAKGSASLADPSQAGFEFNRLHTHLRKGTVLLSGRSLQHGDADQANRNQEIFTNCSTAPLAFLSFYLLLNGSGVGRSYDDELMAVDWSYMPKVVCSIDPSHKDVVEKRILATDRAAVRHMYSQANVIDYTVGDSREAWSKSIEFIEAMTFSKEHRDTVVILDFSDVRPYGSPIAGMQNRPASGPGPLMQAIDNASQVRDAGMEPWLQAMYIDHFLAECVRVGGARRAARIAVKTWRDRSVLAYISIKAPLELIGKSPEEIKALRKANPFMFGFLWSANNSIGVDEEFWAYVNTPVKKGYKKSEKGCLAFPWPESMVEAGNVPEYNRDLHLHAIAVFEATCEAAYYHGTGEPAFINQDKLSFEEAGLETINADNYIQSEDYNLEEDSKAMVTDIIKRFMACVYKAIVNPCGEIVLSKLGAYCVIGDVVPFHSDSLEEAEDAFVATARALMRLNTLPSLFRSEVLRTNRIGVGFTGIHEWAFDKFGFGFADLVDEEKSKPFWMAMSRFKRAVNAECISYAKELGVVVPHTNSTVKPAGTTSKLFNLSEGAHLAAMREYLRWVQFQNGDPLIAKYKEMGYPVRDDLTMYDATTIVGFPTSPVICDLGMGDKLIIASEATPVQQYQWLALIEKYWIIGVEEDGTPIQYEGRDTGNQVSYTLKYEPKTVGYDEFRSILLEWQPKVRCCSVMPNVDSEGSSYEYLPEEPVTKADFQRISQAITKVAGVVEDIGMEHVECGVGGCPVDFEEGGKA